MNDETGFEIFIAESTVALVSVNVVYLTC